MQCNVLVLEDEFALRRVVALCGSCMAVCMDYEYHMMLLS